MRLFVALDLPWALREQLSDLSTGLPGTRWVVPENYHITLRFIGELPPFKAEEVDASLAALRGRSFDIVLTGVGTHERSGKVAALWVGVERNPALDHLQAKIETALQRAGLPAERRRFSPHVTLARIDRPGDQRLAEWIQARNLYRSPVMRVEHFTLFSSLLGKEQAAYTAEAEYGLG